MIVQWCVKGMHLAGGQADARAILDARQGLSCSWWRTVHEISRSEIRDKLYPGSLDMHVNHFDRIDPATGVAYSVNSPYISLSGGTIERNTAAQTNHVRGARHTALEFGLRTGDSRTAFLFRCWVVLAPRLSERVEGVAEEVRDVNSFRRFSVYQTEGEITAKIWIPDNQIEGFETWEWDRGQRALNQVGWCSNPRFTRPEQLSNIRGLL